jgi:hypothetical protein
MKNLTTIHLNPPRARLSQVLPLPVMIAVIIFALLAGTALISRLGSSTAAAVPTPSLPIIILATAQAQPLPTPAAVVQVIAPAQARRWVTAFAAPGGDVLGPIPEPAASAILARYGNDWVMVAWQAGQVWIRAADLGLGLADIAPQIAPAPQVIYQVVNQPAQAAQDSPQQAEAPQPAIYSVEAQQPATALPTAPPAAPAIQAEYPTRAPMQQSEVDRNWAAEQYAAEHRVGQ